MLSARLSQDSEDPPEHASKRRKANVDSSLKRRSTSACHRCRSKKLKCHLRSRIQRKCEACIKADSDCVYDVPPEVLSVEDEARDATSSYVASLESKIAALEEALFVGTPRSSLGIEKTHDRQQASSDLREEVEINGSNSGTNLGGYETANGQRTTFSFSELVERQVAPPVVEYFLNLPHSSLQTQRTAPGSQSAITVFNLLQSGPAISEVDIIKLPDLPSSQVGNSLVEAVYLYTQARYCIVDWVQMREWHQQRNRICFLSTEDDVESQTGAYFVWIIYAIGACYVRNPEYPPKAYFARALKYLPAVLSLQNLTTVQALLCFFQYNVRASGGPPVWHIVGITLRLCIELGYHRSHTISADGPDPYALELRKRFFWCAYCFDRAICAMTRRPFGIHDLDIDVETPVNIDVTCNDQERIRSLQISQAAGSVNYGDSIVTTMSSCLHHLQMYRLTSRILTRFAGPHALPPSREDVMEFLSELHEWKATVPRTYTPGIPRQTDEFVQSMFLQTVLLTVQPVLLQTTIQPDLLLVCAETAADTCENAKILSLSPQTHLSLHDLYQNFYCGIILLQCLAVQSTILPSRRALRAIIACSSTLAVYTPVFPVAAPFRELFEKLSEEFLGSGEGLDAHYPNLESVLREIMSTNPTDIPRILRSLSDGKAQASSASTRDTMFQHSFATAGDFSSILGMGDLTVPFEMASDIYSQNTAFPDLTSFWTDS